MPDDEIPDNLSTEDMRKGTQECLAKALKAKVLTRSVPRVRIAKIRGG